MKPFTADWWNTIANKALRMSKYNIKYKELTLFCWQRAELKSIS
jgi:hypothetical protein